MGFKKKTNSNRAKPKREKYRCRNGNCSIKGISPKKMEAIQLLPPTKTIWDPTVENDCDHEGNCRGNWVPKRFAEERVLSEWHKQQTRKKREPNFDGADISALIKELKDKGYIVAKIFDKNEPVTSSELDEYRNNILDATSHRGAKKMLLQESVLFDSPQ